MFRRLHGTSPIRPAPDYWYFRASFRYASMMLIAILCSLPSVVYAQESATPVAAPATSEVNEHDTLLTPSDATDNVSTGIVATPNVTTISGNSPSDGCLADGESQAPAVGIAPLDFGTMRWDGSSWTSATASTTVEISQNDCGDPNAYDIRIEIVGSIPGFTPQLVGVSTSSEVAVVGAYGDPNSSPLTIAHIDPDFTGSATIELIFQLNPGDELQAGTHFTQIVVTAIKSP